MTGTTDGIYKVCEWLTRFAYINLLFILFSLAGVGIFGIVPSLIAMITIINKWFNKEEFSVFHTFLNIFKQHFLKGNILAILFLMIGCMIIFNIITVPKINMIQAPLKYGTFFIIVFFSIIVLYSIPIMALYNLSIINTIKYAFIIGASHPLNLLAWGLGLFVTYNSFRILPGIVPIFGFSSLCLLIYIVTKRPLNKLANIF